MRKFKLNKIQKEILKNMDKNVVFLRARCCGKTYYFKQYKQLMELLGYK